MFPCVVQEFNWPILTVFKANSGMISISDLLKNTPEEVQLFGWQDWLLSLRLFLFFKN